MLHYKVTQHTTVNCTLGLSLCLSRCCVFLGIYTKYAEHDVRPGSGTGLVLFWGSMGPDTTILMTETNQISKMSHFEQTNHNTAKNLRTFWLNCASRMLQFLHFLTCLYIRSNLPKSQLFSVVSIPLFV